MVDKNEINFRVDLGLVRKKLDHELYVIFRRHVRRSKIQSIFEDANWSCRCTTISHINKGLN